MTAGHAGGRAWMQRKPLILASLLLAALVINVDTTIVNVALPTLVRELHASTTELEWIVDAYNLVFAALVLGAGNLGDRVGRKGVLLAGLGVFATATLAGGLGSSPGELIGARAAMGLGAALIFPATLSLLTNVFTERGERARAIGLWGATTGVGIAMGPIVGGWLLERFSWSSVFFALAPVAVLAAGLVLASVPTSRDPAAPPADRAGLVLSTAAMALLIYTIIEAPNHGWTAPLSVGGLAGSLALLGAFIVRERRASAPMLDVELFRNPRFSAASGAVTITFFSLKGFIFLVTLYFQFLKGYSPLSTGLRLLPVASVVGVTSVAGTRLAVRSGTRLVVATGLASLAAGLAWTSSASATTSYLTIAGQMVLIGSGIGLTSAPATESIMGVVPLAKAGVGSAINDATRILGGTLGVAVIGSIYASLYADRLSSALPPGFPERLAGAAQDSVGSALGVAGELGAGGQAALARTIHEAATLAFFDGFQTACLVAAGVSAAGVLFAVRLLPARPPRPAMAAHTPTTEGVHMRRIVWSEYISLDGVVDEPGEWSLPYFSDDLAKYKSDELFASDALLLGRVTYEAFAAAWPTMEEIEGDFAVRMNTLPKYVASTTLEQAEWNNSTIIRQNVPDAVAKLKRESGKDILIGGSAALAKTLIAHELIDEIRMLVHPIAVGTGKRLFEGANGSIDLKLVDTQTFDSGVVALTYHQGG